MCTGGSASIGGTGMVKPTAEVSSSGGGTTVTLRELKCSTSWAMADTSAYRVGSHDPPHRSVWAIGQLPRRSSHTG